MKKTIKNNKKKKKRKKKDEYIKDRKINIIKKIKKLEKKKRNLKEKLIWKTTRKSTICWIS